MGANDATVQRLQREIAALPRAGFDVADVFRQTLRRLDPHLPSDGWCGLMMDPATLLMTGGVHERGLAPEVSRRLFEIEHGEDDVNLIAELARRPSPVGLLSEAVHGQLESSVRYREVLRPSGFEHELRAVARSGSRAWGALVLLRHPSSADFDERDKRLLEALMPSLAEAIRGALLLGAASDAPASTDRAVIVLGPHNSIETATPAGLDRLDALAEFGPPDAQRVPQTVQALANETRRSLADGAAARVQQVRVRSRDGHWLTLHGTLMSDGGRVAILIEPSRPLEVASLILDAYGLTQREGELVHYVLQGFDTGQIAELLAISAYTVQDHLKKVFDKVGVWSRKELVQRLFFKHYLPRMQQGLPLGPDGWFLERR